MIRSLLALSRSWHDRQPFERVSEAWLREQARREKRAGHDGVAWKFPLNKTRLNDGRRNAKRLRVVA